MKYRNLLEFKSHLTGMFKEEISSDNLCYLMVDNVLSEALKGLDIVNEPSSYSDLSIYLSRSILGVSIMAGNNVGYDCLTIFLARLRLIEIELNLEIKDVIDNAE